MAKQPKQSIPKPDSKFKELVWPIFKRMPTYLRLGFALAKDPAIPHRHKLVLYSTVVYQFTPIHWVVTPIPVVGQLDFPILLLLSIRQMVANCPASVSRPHFDALSLSPTQFQDDMDALLKFGGDVASDTKRRVGSDVKFAGRVVRYMGLKSLARVVVATEKPRSKPAHGTEA